MDATGVVPTTGAEIRSDPLTLGPRLTLRMVAAVFLGFFLFSLGLNLIVVDRLPSASPIDVFSYADGLDRAIDGEVARRGQDVLAGTLDHLQRVGVYGLPADELAEARRQSGDQIPSTAYVHPPTYFFATAALVQVGQWVLPEADSYQFARIANAIWVAVGATILLLTAVLWGARPWPAALVLAAFLPMPSLVTMQTFVTPDAMALLTSSVVLLAATLWWQGHLPVVWLLPAAAFAGVAKQTHLLAVFAALLLVALLWWTTRMKPWTEVLRALALLTAGAVTAGLLWEFAKSSLALPGSPGTPQEPDFFSLDASANGFISTIGRAAAELPGAAAGSLIPLPQGLLGLGAMLTLALAGAAGGAALYIRRTDPRFCLGAGGFAAVVLGSLMISVTQYFASRGWTVLPPSYRYIMGAFPLYAIPLLLAGRHRPVAIGGACIALTGTLLWMTFPVTPAA